MWMYPTAEWPPLIGMLTEDGQQYFDNFTSVHRAYNLELADFELSCRNEPAAAASAAVAQEIAAAFAAFHAWRLDNTYGHPDPEASALLVAHRKRFRREREALRGLYRRVWTVLGESVAVEWEKKMVRKHDRLLFVYGVISEKEFRRRPASDNQASNVTTPAPNVMPAPEGQLFPANLYDF